jgi:uncharacterized metal-binding protein YceD (DUF177 family)
MRLDEIQPNKTISRTLVLERLEIEDGAIVLRDLTAELHFRRDPLGYVLRYDVRGQADMKCIRCNGPLTEELCVQDWVSLRLQQPEEHHIVLNDSEMNVRFIADHSFDMTRFVTEAVELALPDYPRHEEDDSACSTGFPEDPVLEEAKASPFQELSRYLDE